MINNLGRDEKKIKTKKKKDEEKKETNGGLGRTVLGIGLVWFGLVQGLRTPKPVRLPVKPKPNCCWFLITGSYSNLHAIIWGILETLLEVMESNCFATICSSIKCGIFERKV